MKFYRYMIISLVALLVALLITAFLKAAVDAFYRFEEISRKDVGQIKSMSCSEFFIIETDSGYFVLDEPISVMKVEHLYISNRKNGSEYLCDKDDKQCKKIKDNY